MGAGHLVVALQCNIHARPCSSPAALVAFWENANKEGATVNEIVDVCKEKVAELEGTSSTTIVVTLADAEMERHSEKLFSESHL